MLTNTYSNASAGVLATSDYILGWHNVQNSEQKCVALSKILHIMPRSTHPLLPRLQEYLTEAGENIRLARLRRKLSTAQIAERAAISRTTLVAVEKGAPHVSMGTYVQVIFTLGLEKTVRHLAEDDALGRKLQDAGLVAKERAPKRTANE